jgi:hypothetical protein
MLIPLQMAATSCLQSSFDSGIDLRLSSIQYANYTDGVYS